MAGERTLTLSRKATSVFEDRGFENPRLEAELLLAGVLGLKRLELYLQHDRPVDPAELERFRAAVRRRLRHEPLQYILGVAAFRRLELLVDPRVLIPRPETEVLVGLVLDWAARGKAGRALDVGTGSGAIALSLAAEGRFSGVLATDVSPEALDVARTNAARAGLESGIELRHGPGFEPLRRGETFSVIVSNPPYVAESERDLLPPEVRDHEPGVALFAGAGGLDVIEALCAEAGAWLEPGGLLALEIGLGQADAVLERVGRAGVYTEPRMEADLTGRPRFVLAERVAS